MNDDVVLLLHRVLRLSHIVCGFAGLIVYWFVLFLPKGTPWHVRLGKSFVMCALWVSVSGYIASVWAILDPLGFIRTFRPDDAFPSTPELEAQLRFLFVLLAVLSLATAVATWFGVRVIRTRHRHEALREPWLLALEGVYLLNSFAAIAFGVVNLQSGYLAKELCGALIGLGLFTTFTAVKDLRYILRPRVSPMAWWYQHMEQMFGVGVGFHTAFLVFGAGRFFSAYLPGAFQALPWVLPSLIGIPLGKWWVRRYRAKFGDQ